MNRRYSLTEDDIRFIRARCGDTAATAALDRQDECNERPDRDSLIDAARAVYSSNNIDIDNDAALSPTDDGCWVEGWLWVPYEEGDQA